MTNEKLLNLIEVAAGRRKADIVITGGKVLNVYSGEIECLDIAIIDGVIAGVGNYEGAEMIDVAGSFILPGFIDAHVHIESSFATPVEFGRLVVPHGTTTVIADPHEIVNVAGIDGFNYMTQASEGTSLDILYQIPSCVPATPFETPGSILSSIEVAELLEQKTAFGLGEMMNFPGVINGNDEVLNKLIAAKRSGKLIDGHAPGVSGKPLNAYVSAGIATDHECTTIDEMNEKINRGMYIQLRHGSAAQDLINLIPGITTYNSRRLLLCCDDRQPKDIIESGHIDELLRVCVRHGLEPVTAVRMATLNSAECYGLTDRGAIAPGKRADVVIVEDLKDFSVKQVFVEGKVVAINGVYSGKFECISPNQMLNSVNVLPISEDKLYLNSLSNRVNAIEIIPYSIVTNKIVKNINLTSTGDFTFDEAVDLLKIAVVERHNLTGNVGVGLIKGYGLKKGAVAQTIAHDSHNIVAIGTSNEEMLTAINRVITLGGGVVVVLNREVVKEMPLPIAALMTDITGEEIAAKIEDIEDYLHEICGVKKDIEPLLSLAFMSLPVIPEIKLTDKGLFDVNTFQFIPIEAE